MSTKINDLANNAQLFAGNTAPSQAVITNVTGAAINLIAVENNCFAIQNVGTVAGATFGWAGKIQESPTTTGASFTDIAGATFAALTSTTGANIIQVINFVRTQQFVRFLGTISGSASSVALDVLVGGQLVQVPV